MLVTQQDNVHHETTKTAPELADKHDKKYWPGIKIPQIQIWLSFRGTCVNISDPLWIRLDSYLSRHGYMTSIDQQQDVAGGPFESCWLQHKASVLASLQHFSSNRIWEYFCPCSTFGALHHCYYDGIPATPIRKCYHLREVHIVWNSIGQIISTWISVSQQNRAL